MSGRLRRRRPRGWIVVAALLVCWLGVRTWQNYREARAPEVLADEEYTVQRVVDGDTLLLTNNARVRLLGIDAPERHGNHPEPFAVEATDFVRQFIGRQDVHLQFDRERVDRYGRFLAYVYVEEQLLNEAIVRAGMAQARTDFNFSERYKRIFRAAERDARERKIGIWSTERAP